MSTLAERFSALVKVAGPDECWEWQGKPSRYGYGRIRGRGKLMFAHRLAYEFWSCATIPAGLLVCHECDNRMCCNPAHLWLGTNDDNMADVVAKGRSRGGNGGNGHSFPGELHPSAKLTEAKVLTIFGSRMGTQYLATQYGVTRRTIQKIKARKSWAVVHSRQVVSNTPESAARVSPSACTPYHKELTTSQG